MGAGGQQEVRLHGRITLCCDAGGLHDLARYLSPSVIHKLQKLGSAAEREGPLQRGGSTPAAAAACQVVPVCARLGLLGWCLRLPC